jgi:predicted ATPase/DNA-binding CsgD family transcriptional regulator
MLALGEFSVSELVHLSGVAAPTVRTILRRETELIERAGSESTGRRGGQPYRWRLRPEASARLRSELEKLELLGVGPWLGDPPSEAEMIPAGIVAAEHVLLRRIPETSVFSKRAELIELAQSQLDAASAVTSSASGSVSPRISDHKRIVELLLELEHAEQAAHRDQESHADREVRRITRELQLIASEIEDSSIARALKVRLTSSSQSPKLSQEWEEVTATRQSRHNLPIEPNKFVGRQRELAELTAKLSDARVITLCGPGGIGKTRLAHNLASEVVAEFADGAWLVELADAVEPDPIARLVAGAMGIKEEPGRKAVDTLAGALRSRHVLLILDSCEASRHASAELVQQLTKNCPWVCVLATSREPLGLRDEIVWKVPPLSMPDRRYKSSVSGFPKSEAMRLFTRRAVDAMPGFALDKHTANAVAQLCRALVGMPLGIELAAAQVRALPVEQIKIRLTRKVKSIIPAEQAVSGQRALMAAVDWSYEMLSEQEQILLRRLSVFAGWYLEMAEEVCKGDDIPRGKVSALLADLVDKSLVTLDHEVAGEARYGMLDTIREFAKDRLATAGEQIAISARHRDYLLNFAENIVSVEFGSGGPTWHDRVTMYRQSCAERENYAAALSFCLDQGDSAEGLRLCSALRGGWIVRGEAGEGADWFDRFLALDGDVAPKIRATALVMRAELAFEQQDYPAATRHASAGLYLCRDSGIAPPPMALRVLALVCLRKGRLDEALLQAEEAILGAHGAGDDWEEGLAFSSKAAILARKGLFRESERSYKLALDILKNNNGWGVARTLFGLGELARTRHNNDSASRYFTESLALYRDIDDRPEISRCLAGIGWIALTDGNLERAASSLSESLELNVAMGQRLAIARSLEAFAVLAMLQNDPARSVQLQGAALDMRDPLGHPPSERGQERIDDLLESARERLGSAAVEDLIAEGRKLTPQEAARLAIAGARSRPRYAPENKPATLTSMEHQIATLVSHGLSTRAIAAELFITPASVGRHVANIQAKLGLASRAQIATWIATEGISSFSLSDQGERM